MSRVAVLRLVTGEEVLTEVTDSNPTYLKVKNPVRIIVVPNKLDPKNPQIALAPFTQFAAKQEFDIKHSLVLLDYEPVADFIDQYKQMFGGIFTPPQKLILPN